jgi:prepilin-type N-terminal cleavage/methylation domain-containing protein
MQKLLRNNKGFTLVEVIVVAVIVLVLAAVAIPLYNGYINDSRKASAENIAGSIASSAGAATQQGGGPAPGAVVAGGYVTMTTPANAGVGGNISILIPKGFTANAYADGTVVVSFLSGKNEASVVATFGK